MSVLIDWVNTFVSCVHPRIGICECVGGSSGYMLVPGWMGGCEGVGAWWRVQSTFSRGVFLYVVCIFVSAFSITCVWERVRHE